MVQGMVGSEKAMMLVDSGAMVTLVNLDLLKNQPVKIGVTSRRIRGVTGHTLNVVGEASIPLVINGQAFAYECVIVEGLGYDVILGYDLMKHRGYMLDFSKVETLTVNTEYTSDVSLVRDIQIPGRTKKWVWATPTWVPDRNQDLVIQAKEMIKPGVYVEGALTQMNNKDEVLICLINENIHDESLERATSVGVVEGLGEEDIPVVELEEFYLSNPRCGGASDINITLEGKGSSQARVDAILQSTNTATLTVTQKNIVRRLVSNIPEVFALDDEILPSTHLMKFKIATGDAAPIRQRAYRLPQFQRKPLGELLGKLRREGIIRPSSSEWAAPVLMVPKKTQGQYRLCVDYRRLNEVVKSDSYPLPRIDDLLDRLEGSKVFSTLDLKWGYHQCQIEESDIPKTAFICCEGLFEYTKMAMGLKNAPSCFQRLLETVFADMLGKGVLVYIDDLILFTNTEEEHELLLEKVFKRLVQAGLSLKPEKCHYFQAEIEYLGHVVSDKGLFPLQANIQKILDYKPPATVRQLRGFLGLASYYRKFIRDFARVARPLTEMTGSKVPFQWTERQQEAFDLLKEKLTTPPILAYPKFDQEFILFTDASDTAIGCVLSQMVGGKEVVVAYGSRTLNKAERNYSTVEKECLAVVHFTQEYRHYLLGRTFRIISDHRPLVWLKNLNNPTGRLGRWALKLSEFDYEIIYRKGRLNNNADFLSRMNEEIINEVNMDDQGGMKISVSGIKSAQNKDGFCKAMIAYLRRQELPSVQSKLRERIPLEAHNYLIRSDGVLLCHFNGSYAPEGGVMEGGDPVIILPKSLRDEVLVLLHDHKTSGHLGFKKTLNKVRSRFYWEGMYTDVKRYTQSCVSCNKSKTPPVRRCAPLSNYTRATYPLDRIQIDIIGPIYPRTYSGMGVILVITDEFTRFSEAIALPDQKAVTVAQALVNNFLLKYGIPRVIHTDQGRNFVSSLLQEITQVFGITKIVGSAYHPQSQGAVERCNRVLKEMLTHYVQSEPREWDRFVPFVMHAYNTSISASTLFSPYFLFFGREAILPVDTLIHKPGPKYKGADDYKMEVVEKMFLAHQQALRYSDRAREKQKIQYDKRAKFRKFEVGDTVYVTDEAIHSRRMKDGMSRKFAQFWRGPYLVVQKLSDVNFKIKKIEDNKVEIVHVNRLKLQGGSVKRRGVIAAEQSEEGRGGVEGGREGESSDEEVFEDIESHERQSISEQYSGQPRRTGLRPEEETRESVESESDEDVGEGMEEDEECVKGEVEKKRVTKSGEEDVRLEESMSNDNMGVGMEMDEENVGSEVAAEKVTKSAEGAVSWPCGVCGLPIFDSGPKATPSIRCTRCEKWVHQQCSRFGSIAKMKRSELRGYKCGRCLEVVEASLGQPLPQRGSAQKSCTRSVKQERAGSAPIMGQNGELWCEPLASENILPTRLRQRERQDLNVISTGTVAGNIPRYLRRGGIFEGKYQVYSAGGLMKGAQVNHNH